MKCGARVALGVAGGYFLGRTKKMKLALMLGGMAAGRRAGGPGELLAQGQKLLNSSPELSALSDQVRGRLLDAGKGAVMAVAARQVSSLTDKVGKRVESLGDLGGGAAGGAKKAAGGLRDTVDQRDGDADEDEEAGPVDETEEVSDEEAEPESADEGEAPEEASDETQDAEPEEQAPPRRRTAKAREGGGSGTARRSAAAGTRTARSTTSRAGSGGAKAARGGAKAASGTATKAASGATKAAAGRKGGRRRSEDA
ncbi:hypothetical protein [Pseudonocardia xishanensis]|uniref:DNA primase n=1 Tax=Pseudonocardia xishanensis TaxID=630995 RepID=A0ABP8RTG7_9PSEU